MSVRSMTGFARVRKPFDGGEIAISVKGVNHRGLDLHFRLPSELEALESELRAAFKNSVARGHLEVQASVTRAAGASSGPAPVLNRALLDAYCRAFQEAATAYGLDGRPDLNAALNIPGMLSLAGEEELGEDLSRAALEAAAEALAALNEFREREGAAIAGEMRERCQAIHGLAARMEEIRAGALPVFHKRLRERLADLLGGAGIEPQRLAQEAALLADRSDIAEELIRLRTHATQLESLLGGSEVGKRLDFLLQEMNREANTILSKTGGLGDIGLTMTDLALAAKSEIEKIREQSLNLE